jgi:predicted nucleotidyltransferase
MVKRTVDILILNIINQYIEELKKKYNIKEVYIFGSYVKGNNHEYSDIDVAIVSDDFKNLFNDGVELMLLSKKIDLRIEPHPFTTKDFEYVDPLVEEIKDTGLKIA